MTDAAVISAPAERLAGIVAGLDTGAESAISQLETLLAEYPESAECLGHLSWAYANAARHPDSIALLERLAALQPENPEPLWRIGDRLINLNRIDESEARYRETAARFPDCEDARMGVRYAMYLRRKASKGDAEKSAGGTARRIEPTELQRTNLERNAREFESQRIRLDSMPPRLYLTSTTKCNFFCRTCSKGYEAYHAEDLRTEIQEKVRRELMPTNCRISITGFGEPTLASNFDSILSMGVDNGSEVHFVTNASLLGFDRIEKLTRTPADITISFDGATKETFEAVRNGSNFELILEKLAMIKKLRDVYLNETLSRFSFNFVALRRNIDELADVVRIAARYRISVINVADYAFNQNEFDEESLRNDPDHANDAIARAMRVARELGVELLVPPDYSAPTDDDSGRGRVRLLPERNRFPRKCSSPWTEPYLDADGRVSPCCANYQYLGHLGKSDFPSIWNGWRYRFLRRRIHSVMPPPGCRTCFLPWGINGGNAGNVMAKEGAVVRFLYRMETDMLRPIARRLRDFLRGLRVQKPSVTTAPGSHGTTFYKGRPLSERNRPGATD